MSRGGKPLDPFRNYVKTLSKEGESFRWQCIFCDKSFSGSATRIKLHLGHVEGQGIQICRGHVPLNVSETARQALLKDPIQGYRRTKRRRSMDGDGQGGDHDEALRSIQEEMDSPVCTPDQSVATPRTIEANMGELLAAAKGCQLHVGPSGTVIQQYNLQNVPSLSCPPSPHHEVESQDMSPPASTHELVANTGDDNFGVQSSLLPNTSILPRDFSQVDEMQVDQDPCSVRDQSLGAVSPRPNTRLIRDTTNLDEDAILVTEIVGKEIGRIVDKTKDCITKDNLVKVGIYGMGGVGKTTIVKRLYNELRATFDDLLWVTVSKDCSIHELQNKIANALNVPDLFNGVDKAMRPTLLFKHLKNKKKSLTILDDMWQHFELEEVGIPDMKDDNHVILTTRDRSVCQRMLCQEIIEVKPLNDEEAWSLFVKTLGSDPSSSHLSAAKSIAKECKGLPLAIVVMAASMRGVDGEHGWVDTLEKLKQPEAEQQDMQRSVFPILQHSYNHLHAKKQQCFLRCALYPEDWEIPREELIELCIDEGVLRGDSRWKMYNEGHQLLDELEKACLLESVIIYGFVSREKRVKMHDVIRDMALDIMNANSPCMVKSGLHLDDMPDEDEWMPTLEKVSLIENNHIETIPTMSPNCPQLSTLLLIGWERLREISGCFFERIQELMVIDLSHTRITKVPESITNLEKLNALILRSCSELSFVPCLAKLTTLRKLDLRGCLGMKEVPDGLAMLIQLIYLDLSDTSIERIPEGVIGKLLKLEYLHMGYVEVKVDEIAKLKKLESLCCRFENVNELREYIQHKTKMKSYILIIGFRGSIQNWLRRIFRRVIHGDSDPMFDYDSMWGNKAIILGDTGQYRLGETLHLPRDVKTLWFERCNGTWINTCRLEDLEVIKMNNCHEVSALNGSGSGERLEGPDPEVTLLSPLPPSEGHFPNLKKLLILDCSKLKHLLVHGRRCSPLWCAKLEELAIVNCEQLKSIIGAEAAAEDEQKESKASTSTSSLPHYTFSQVQSIGVQVNMEEIVTMPSRPPPPPPTPMSTLQLPLLRKLYVCGADKMKRVLTLESFMLLPNLEDLRVAMCKQMKEVIGQETEHGPISSSSRHTSCMFSSPTRRPLSLALFYLPKLDSICSWTPIRNFIQILIILKCPKLKRIPMLDGLPSCPPSLEKICVYPYEWWEALEWHCPEAKLALEPYVFIRMLYGQKEIPIQEWRDWPMSAG